MASKNNYFETFCKISKAFGTITTREKLLSIIVQSATEAMNAKASSLFLTDETQGVFVIAAQYGLSENYLHVEPKEVKSVIRQLHEAGGYLAYYDAGTDTRLENHAEKIQEGIASILVVPVKVNDKIIGVLTLYTAEHREFSREDIAFLTALSEQGGIAIQQARLIERINQNSKLFYDLSSNINSSLDIKSILHILSAEIGESFGMMGVTIRTFNPETQMMDLIAAYGLSEAFLGKGPISAEKSVVVQKVLKGETVIINDIPNDNRVQYPTESVQEGIVSSLCVPLKSKDRVIGEIRLYSNVQRDFPEDMINLINALAHQGGIAIENAQLVKRMRMNTEFFHDLAVSVNSTLDVRKILHIMSADIAETIGVKASSIRLFDDKKKTLELVASYGLSEKYLSKGPISVSGDRGISDALQNRVDIIRNAAEDEGVQYRKEKAKENIVSILSVPINARDDVIGVLRLYSGEERNFTEDDIMLAMAMAHQGGLAIQNASMYLKLQEDKEDLENEIWTHKSWF